MTSSKWCVKPLETDPIEMTWQTPDGETLTFWIRLKQRLTVGEERKVTNAGWSGFRPQNAESKAEIAIDWRETAFAKALVWLTQWSLEDDQRNRMPVSRDVLESLDPDVFTLIEDAITAHVKGLAEEKKQRNGAIAPSLTSA